MDDGCMDEYMNRKLNNRRNIDVDIVIELNKYINVLQYEQKLKSQSLITSVGQLYHREIVS
jgi:hypothetical protein